jgi:hypothetical protein
MTEVLIADLYFEAFAATKFNKIFSGIQPLQSVGGRNRRFGNHLCPYNQNPDNGDRDGSGNVGFFLQPIDAAVCPRRFY